MPVSIPTTAVRHGPKAEATPILRQMRPVVAEVELLVPTRLVVDLARKLGGAAKADVGEEIDDVIHLIGR